MRLDRHADPGLRRDLACPGEAVDHDLIFCRPVPFRLDACRPFLRDRPLQDRPDLGFERIGRHAGDDGRADLGNDVDAAPERIEIDTRRRRTRLARERQIVEEIRERETLAVGQRLQLADLLRRIVVRQHAGRPCRQLEALAAGAGEPQQRPVEGRVPGEGPDRGSKEQRTGGHAPSRKREQPRNGRSSSS